MATKQQVPVIAARLTEFQEEFMDLPTEDSQWVIMHGKESARLFVDAVINHRINTGAIASTAIFSEPSNITIISATTKSLIARDTFKIDENQRNAVKIIHIGDNFYKWFLDKVEQPFSGSTIYGQNLNRRSVDLQILSELGGLEKVETTLTEIYVMMERQGTVEVDLLDSKNASIFYVRDSTGVIRVVRLRWDYEHWQGWIIDACSLGLLRGHEVGVKVFSHNASALQKA